MVHTLEEIDVNDNLTIRLVFIEMSVSSISNIMTEVVEDLLDLIHGIVHSQTLITWSAGAQFSIIECFVIIRRDEESFIQYFR